MKILVSEPDLDLLQVKWQISKNTNWYAARMRSSPSQMHQQVMQRILGRRLTLKDTVDHIDRNKLNNRRENLRLVTRSENAMNSTARVTNKSGFKGVCWHAGQQQWVAAIMKDYTKLHIGYFDDPLEAAYMYDQWALALFGEIAYLNAA